MIEKEVIINGKQLKLRYTLRGLFVYEEIAGEPYNDSKTLNTYVLLYAMLVACNPQVGLTFDEVVDACDESNEPMAALVSVMEDHMRRMGELAAADGDAKKKAAP